VALREESLVEVPGGDEWFDREWALELLRRAVRLAAADAEGAAEQSPGDLLLAALMGRSRKAKARLLAALRRELRVVCRNGFIEEELLYLMQVLVAAVTHGWAAGTENGGTGR
jgi:hypothetical protein